ncbi:MAG: phosphatase PAP2 family protein [Candidatus Acidiferrales bacterium]
MSAHLKPSMNRLDRLAIGMIAVAALFVAWAVPVPFLLWTMLGSAVLLMRQKRELAVIAIFLPVFVILRAPLNYGIVLLTPHTVDAALLSLDYGFSAMVYSWFSHHAVAFGVIRFAYLDALPFWIAVVLAFADKPMQIFRLMVWATIAAVPCYLLCPAVGPVWIHTANAPRNCMPSLHLAWALLILWYSPRYLRIPSAVLVALTALATLGLGEHYAIDLVAALPFTVAVCALARFPFARIKQRALSPSEGEIGSSFNTPDSGFVNPSAK